MENLKMPELRFPGFEGTWEAKFIKNVLQIGSGKDYKHLDEGNIPVYGTGGLMNHVNDFLYDGESVCIGRKGTIDKPNFIVGKFWTVDTLFYTHSFNNVIPFFMFLIAQKINWKKYNEASGVPSLSKSTIEKIAIVIPTLPEQQKIASFFTTIDKKIELLKKKHSLLEQYKKGVMQKIFSQKIRFKDSDGNDYGAWEEKKLGEVGTLFSGGTPKSTNRDYYIGEIPFIRSGEINSSNTKLFISESGLKSSSAKIVKKGDLLYALYGATSGEVAISKIEGAINQAILCVRTNLNSVFLYNYLSYTKQRIIKTYIQGGQGNLSGDIIKSILIPVPCIQEQTKIANFLSSIDKKIEKVQLQIDKAEEWKKGLLGRMFC